jgi:hypothetical protein
LILAEIRAAVEPPHPKTTHEHEGVQKVPSLDATLSARLRVVFGWGHEKEK